jgi:hypothetical protein
MLGIKCFLTDKAGNHDIYFFTIIWYRPKKIQPEKFFKMILLSIYGSNKRKLLLGLKHIELEKLINGFSKRKNCCQRNVRLFGQDHFNINCIIIAPYVIWQHFFRLNYLLKFIIEF